MPTQPSNFPLPSLLIKEPVTQDEIRKGRIQYFDNQSVIPVDVNDDNKMFRANRMKVREDMIKHFLTKEVCIFHIMLVVIVALAFLFILLFALCTLTSYIYTIPFLYS